MNLCLAGFGIAAWPVLLLSTVFATSPSVPELPKTISGKIRRSEIRKQDHTPHA